MTEVSSAEHEVSEWDLEPGDVIERKQLHAKYGGRTQGAIGPSAKTPNVMIFTDPIAGEKHGYYDGWMPDGFFHYSGEGQYGDQRMLSGNASILNHAAEGRALRVFQGARGNVTYLGRFAAAGWYEADAPETGGGPLRKVIVFKLRPLDTPPQHPGTKLGRLLAEQHETVTEIDIERLETEKTFVDPNREPYEAERRESKLVLDFSAYLRTKGHRVNRQRILPAGDETRPLLTDLYVPDLDLLIEAKGSVTRENMRMALGQLIDYNRFVGAKHQAILVPSKPRPDLIELVRAAGQVIIWPEGNGYKCSDAHLLPHA
ncbi:restriction endonuclease [Streptomyces lavenduligriseus]|uniref:Restriction endonuclease n=1 Tax=Streptomyces lavenduligriseus TaxID=67315 RepID=A0ABT0NQ83_9ACTN|nr:restriction endonuclease [Streptomyces lavenduligriseus]MCL3992947.1 restriction endonuclease [Streptomyces lavenduligriseus]